jgi:hypothetical protein
MELNGTPDTYIAGMMDAARIVRERKGKYTLEQTANYLEALCTSQSFPSDPMQKTETPFKCETCGTEYAEYVNGCPHCWEAGLRSGVQQSNN